MQANFCFRDIENAVCHSYGIESAALYDSSRANRFCRPRFVACHLARKHTQMSTPQIGQKLKCDHTSVLHGDQRAIALMAMDTDFLLKVVAAEKKLLSSKPFREHIFEDLARTRKLPVPRRLAATWC